MPIFNPSTPSGALPRRRRRPTALMVLGLLLIGSLTAPIAAQASDSPVVPSEDIDQLVEDRMEAHGIPGAAVAVVRDGEPVHLAGYGQADSEGRPVGPDTPFLIGSVSKPFTSLAVHQLIDAGVLSLDQPIAPILAEIVHEPGDGFEDVTIGHLLSHTSGLTMADGLAGTVEVHNGPDAIERRVRDILSRPLPGTAGDQHVYSNAGAVLLAGVVEQVTGERFADYLDSHVFGPLGMDRSFAVDTHPAAGDLATGHRQWFGRWLAADLPYDAASAPNGYIGSTARDLARFMEAHLEGEPADVMPYSAIDVLEGPVIDTGWDIPLEGGHGTGWFVDEFEGVSTVSHAGSLGHFTAHVVLAPEEGLGVAVLANGSAFVSAGHAGQYDLSLELTRMLVGAEAAPATASPLMTIVAPVAVWAAALGILAAAARFVTVRRRQGSRGGRRNTGLARVVLPSVGYVVVGAALLAVGPLDAARHFYPDVGYGLTALAYLALAWGIARAALVSRGRKANQSSESRTETELHAEPLAALH